MLMFLKLIRLFLHSSNFKQLFPRVIVYVIQGAKLSAIMFLSFDEPFLQLFSHRLPISVSRNLVYEVHFPNLFVS